jgi:predicted O-linked N-acetylglucosamine transferase (SPINDLY family)
MKHKKTPQAKKTVNKTVVKKFRQALSLHQRNSLDEAESLYLEILKQDIRHADSLNMLGLIAHQKNQPELALNRFSEVMRLSPLSAEPYFNSGIVLQSLGHWQEAISSYDMALIRNPRHTAAINNLGNTLLSLGRIEEALSSYQKTLDINHDNTEAHFNYGHALYLLGRHVEAIDSFDRALKSQPDNFKAHYRRGLCLQQLQRYQEALDSFDYALNLMPSDVDTLCSSSQVLLTIGRTQEALERFCNAIHIKPDCVLAHMGRGDCLLILRKIDEAVLSYQNALQHQPDLAEAHNNIGAALISLGHLDEAAAYCERALAINPNFAEAHSNLGNALLQLDRSQEAVKSLNEALRIHPGLDNAILNRGLASIKLRKFDEAISDFDSLLTLQDRNSTLHGAKGFALMSQGRVGDAIPYFEKALSLDPENPTNYCNLGVARMSVWLLHSAVNLFEEALERHPNQVEVLNNLGQALVRLKILDRAVATYSQILELEPDRRFALGTLLSVKMHMCDWDKLDENKNKMEYRVRERLPTIYPFPFLALTDDPHLHKLCATAYTTSSAYQASNIADLPTMEEKNEKIRIGYYSADFHNHATAYLMAELIELHDRDRFEIYGFSYGPQKNDEMKTRLYEGFDEFIEVGQYGERQIASLSRVLGMDIAVDLKGYTEGSRMGIFIERCAPIQVSYLGYPGTTTLAEMDYIIGDPIVTPEGCDSDYTEKIIRLPHSYQVNDSKRKIADTEFKRQELDLPEHGIVFCCFNNNYKILPETFDSWMRILKATEGSVLWLLSDNPWAEQNLRKQAAARGVDPGRLVFAKRMPLNQHLARFRHADIFLDTFPYNAHTTASDALWTGVPVITRSGRSFASRVAASLLTSIGLADLVFQSVDEYEAAAIDLALNQTRLSEIKNRLKNNRSTFPLFDARRFARNLENSFIQIHARNLKGLTPVAISISDPINSQPTNQQPPAGNQQI